MDFDFNDDFSTDFDSELNSDFNDGFDDIFSDGLTEPYDDGFDFDDEDREKHRRESSRENRARRDEQRQKARRKKLIARRATIVGFAVLLLILVIASLVAGTRWLVKSIGGGTQETVAETVAPTEPKRIYTFKKPDIADDKKSEGYYSSANGNVYIYNKAALETFMGDDASAKSYAECISEFKALVGDKVTVYNMVVPTHIEFAVPQRLIDNKSVETVSQADNLKVLFDSYTEDVIGINCYNKLSEHCKEYLYFNTDYYWTGLGGYYGYQAFCEQSDNKVLNLSVCTDNSVDGFEGQLLYCDMSLYENLDTVHYWTFPYSTYGMRTDSNGAAPYETSIYYPASTAGPYAYGTFLWGDCPLFVEYNSDLTNGKKIAVVKDSFGNPFVPYLTANYEQVHVIDYRYYDGNLQQYCTDNGIDEVLFVNNIENANSSDCLDSLRTIF